MPETPAMQVDPHRPLDHVAGEPAAPDAASPSMAAVRRARADYLARHEPAPERRVRRWAVSPRLALAALGVVVLVGAAVALRAGTSGVGEPVVLATPSPPAAAPAEPTSVVVHVVGAVVAPGLVTLPAGARVGDAVAAAGGSTEEADLSALNLARTLVDGEQVLVPRPGEVVTASAPVDDGLVDINTASEAQLTALPGVGPVMAGRIVDARPFASVDELSRVSGIGPTVLGRLRPLVKV
ncbi:MAG: ComEA family DNA-binding protein [Micrococcales bacterium]|nr:ComEA family DNA-binding protein [Micrococcales bacterium]